MFIYCICTQYLVGAPFALITLSGLVSLLAVLLAVWADAKSCWKMKSVSLKSWSAEGSMKCSIFLVNGLVFKKHNGPTLADDIATQIMTDCGNLTLDLRNLGYELLHPSSRL